ncbi:MAG: tetratricopeptide repeat protein [Chloroflexota bacterium]|nr:tetratricopeptide repeat protein [Chloroflexota bacterium]
MTSFDGDAITAPVPSPQDEMAEIVSAVVAAIQAAGIRELPLDSLSRLLSTTATQGGAPGEGFSAANSATQQQIQDAQTWEMVLRQVLAELDKRKASEVNQQLEHRWQGIRQALFEAFQGDPYDGVASWLKTYAEMLASWDLDICALLVSDPFPFPPEDADLLPIFQIGTHALTSSYVYQDVLTMLSLLTDPGLASASGIAASIDDMTRAVLLIYMGRIYLYHAINSGEARARFDQAIELIPEDGRPHASMGEYYRVQDETAEALAKHQRAIELSPEQPDGYIGEGLLFESDGRWDEAANRYEQAIHVVRERSDVTLSLTDTALVLDRLLAPVSGHLYLQLAKVFREEDPRMAAEAALRAIQIAAARARELLLDHQGEHTQLESYLLLGEIYERLGAKSTAAEAYYEAGRRFNLQNEFKTAIELVERALQLAPDYAIAYWLLSHSLLLSSYLPEVPFVDEEAAMKSLQAWEEGAQKIKHLKTDTSGFYALRATINDQLIRLPYADRWTLWWEAATYLERALVLQPNEPSRLVEIGRVHISLNNWGIAMQALRKALAYDEKNLSALYLYAAALASVGQFAKAKETIDKWRNLTPDSSDHMINAYILAYTGRPAEALTLINTVISKVARPEEIGYDELDLRATCYWMLGDFTKAKEDYSLIWKRYSDSDMDHQMFYGWAAYRLGMLEEARTIFTRMLGDPIFHGQASRNLGLCYLAQGELPLGTKYLQEGIKLASNVRQLDEVRGMDLPDLERQAADAPYVAQLHEVIEALKEEIAARRMQLEQMPSAEEELQRCVRTLQERGDTNSWASVGAHAALARLYTEGRNWQQAAAAYQVILEQESNPATSRFPEALEAHGRLGFLLASDSDPSTVAEHFRQSLHFRARAGLPDTIWDVIGKTPYLITSIEQYENLNAALQMFAGDPIPSI